MSRKFWDWTRCRFLFRDRMGKDGSAFEPRGREYFACSACLLSDNSCTYETIYGLDGVTECGTHKLIRLTKKKKKATRIHSAYDGPTH